MIIQTHGYTDQTYGLTENMGMMSNDHTLTCLYSHIRIQTYGDRDTWQYRSMAIQKYGFDEKRPHRHMIIQSHCHTDP